jgi:hypothetical protein
LKYYYKHSEGLHVNCLTFLSDFNETCHFLTDLNKRICCLQKFVRWERNCFMRADGQTRQSLIVAFRSFPKLPQKHVLLKAIKYRQMNRDSVVGVVTRPRFRWSGVRIPEGARFFFLQNHPYQLCGLPSLLFSVYRGSFPGVKWGAKLTIRRHLDPNLRKIGAISSILPYDSMQWTGTIFIPHTINTALLRYPISWINCFVVFPPFLQFISSGQYPHKSLPTQNICKVCTYSASNILWSPRF